MARIVRIKPFMGLGNRMLQYMMAEAIRGELPDVSVCGPGLPEWNIAAVPEPMEQAFATTLRGHAVPLAEMLALCRRLDAVDIHVDTLSARLCYYLRHRSRFQTLFPVSSHVPVAGEDELVINIRLAEIGAGYHPNYMPVPISWYRELVASTGLRPALMGQLGDDAYSSALRHAFPGARLIPSLGIAGDFDFIARSVHLALPISTFSWVAAWLSPVLRTIHMPVMGLYHPGGRPDHDLLPLADPRYRFYLGERHHWNGSPEQLAELIDGPSGLHAVSAGDLAAQYPGIGSEGLAYSSWAIQRAKPPVQSP